MSPITSLKLIEFRPETAQGRIFVRRRKLADKIDQQINLADDAAYTTTKIVTVTDENGNQQRREVAKRIKRWWVTNADGSVQLTVRYGSKPIEFEKGKAAIVVKGRDDLLALIPKLIAAIEAGEFDSYISSATKQRIVGKKAA